MRIEASANASSRLNLSGGIVVVHNRRARLTLMRKLWTGPAYHFTEYLEPSRPLLVITETNAETLRGGFEDLVEELPAWRPFLALVEEDRAVSVCRSARITDAAHEAGVETLPDFHVT